MLKIFQKGFNFSQDGPGNRLVYHLAGCNFACRWCSNPEGMQLAECSYRTYTLDEIVAECISCRPMFFDGGGVTLTGGEPTLQMDAVIELFARLREQGISTAIETNGSSPRLRELLPLVDHLMMDVKHYDPAVHVEWTGVRNDVTLENFEYLARSGREATIRIPIINGFNNDPSGFAAYFSKFATDKLRFELLPYHEYGKEKWKHPYLVQDGFISADDQRAFRQIFEAHGLCLVTS